jgi:hypothetical protein
LRRSASRCPSICERRRREELGHGAAIELLADHRRSLDDRALLGPEPFDPSREQRMDRGGDLDGVGAAGDRPATVVVAEERPVVEQHSDQLAEEQRVAPRRLEDPLQ